MEIILLTLYSLMAIAKLSDKILLQFMIIALTTALINGTHSIQNSMVSNFPNSLHNITTTKLCGDDIGAIGYIPVFSRLNLLELDLEVCMRSIRSSSSKLYISSHVVVPPSLLHVVSEKSGSMSESSDIVASAVLFPFFTIFARVVFFRISLKFGQWRKPDQNTKWKMQVETQ